jgi:hypothetical protein
MSFVPSVLPELYNIVPRWPSCRAGFFAGISKHAAPSSGILLALQVIAFEPLVFNAASCCWPRRALGMGTGNRAGASSHTTHLAGGAAAAGLRHPDIADISLLFSPGGGIGLEQAADGPLIRPIFKHGIRISSDILYHRRLRLLGRGTLRVEDRMPGSSLAVTYFFQHFFSNRKKLRAALLAFSGIGIVLGLGRFTPVYPWLYEHVPLFNLGGILKYFLLVSLLVSLFFIRPEAR